MPFLIFLYYFSFLNFIHTGFFSFFSPHTYPTHISIYSSFSFSSSLQTLFHSLALSFLLFLFLLDSRTLSSMTSISTSIFFPLYLTSHTHSRPWSFDFSSMFAFLFFIFFLLHLTSLTHTAGRESWPSSVFLFFSFFFLLFLFWFTLLLQWSLDRLSCSWSVVFVLILDLLF